MRNCCWFICSSVVPFDLYQVREILSGAFMGMDAKNLVLSASDARHSFVNRDDVLSSPWSVRDWCATTLASEGECRILGRSSEILKSFTRRLTLF